MEMLFAAIRNQHPGCSILDVGFSVNKLKLDDNRHDVCALDAALAYAVLNAGVPLKFYQL
jgi:hypothetical protein